MSLYPLGNGKFVEVDEEDVVAISFYEWCLASGYAMNWKIGYLHHFIAKRIGLSLSQEIDHKDQNTLNCKRENLREATKSQNQINRKVQKNNNLGLKGIYFRIVDDRYEVRITVNGQCIYVGGFKELNDAIEAREKAEIKYFKEFAYLNY